MLRPSFSIRDNKTGHFSDPMFFNFDKEAVREFSLLAKNDKTKICQFPSDFDLYHVGYYDTDSCRQTSADAPKLIQTGLSAHSEVDVVVTRM